MRKPVEVAGFCRPKPAYRQSGSDRGAVEHDAYEPLQYVVSDGSGASAC